MSHPYQKHREKHPGRERVSKVFGRFARGGKVGKTNINIIVAPGKGEDAPPPMPPMAGPPPMPPKPPMGGPPPGMPMGGPPMPGMKRGGKVPMKAGADSGEGRLQKIKAYGRKARKK